MTFEFPGQARMADVAKAITEAALRPPEPAPALLFTPLVLRGLTGGEGLTLPNRVKLAAMTTGFASPAGLPSERLVEWYGARAAGGTGLVTVEGTLVAPPHPLCSRSRFKQHRLRLDEDAVVDAFRPLTAAIHRGGARAAVQLTYPGLKDAAAVDAWPADEIVAVVRAFGAAAARARAAGFDAVEMQCTYRSLFAQLLSRATNRRRDRYGRGPAGRRRAVLEALAAIRERAGGDLPVLVKYSADEYLARGIRPDGAGGGVAIGQALAQAGAAALEVLAGAVASDADLRFSSGVGEAVLAELAGTVRLAAGIPVAVAGRLLTADGAEAVLRQGQGDLVSVGRAILADPAWLAKGRAGVELEIVPCISCMACYTPAPDGGIGCPANGEAGQEYLPPLPAAEPPRRVTVLGAGLAALEVARVAASRGHAVTLATAGLPLGGLMGLRAGVPGNAEFGRAFLYLGDRLVELGASIAGEPAGTGAGTDAAEAIPDADVVVDARAGQEARPAWASGKGVFLAGDILGRELHQMYGIGRRVAVVGPGALAAEVALFLAGWGRRPTVVVPGPEEQPFPDVHPMHAARLRERLEGYKVPLVTGATAVLWRFDPGRKSELVVRRSAPASASGSKRGRKKAAGGTVEQAIGPFQTAVSAAGWGEADAAIDWPQAASVPEVPPAVPDGAVIALRDTPYPEPLRDLVQYAHRLGRVL
jgi:2,4-dienoyl-CoA reductase-like NADH-dependent reductase (Old Yellow Enzyme family)